MLRKLVCKPKFEYDINEVIIITQGLYALSLQKVKKGFYLFSLSAEKIFWLRRLASAGYLASNRIHLSAFGRTVIVNSIHFVSLFLKSFYI